MNTVNHALWGATLGRIVGLPIQGALIASTPDLPTIPVFFYFYFKGIRPENSPIWIKKVYAILHNLFIAILISLVLIFINKTFWILGLGYLIHVIQDGFLHTKMATSFLYPFWKDKIQVYSAQEHKWIQILDIFLILMANLVISIYRIKLS